MTSIIPSAVPATMSSREIAELTGKQHAHVMRDIRAMIERISADPNLDWHCETETYADEQGKPREMYRMDKDTTLTLVSGYDPVIRFRIIKRWQELEAQPTQSFDLAAMTGQALRELAARIEECAALNTRIIALQPKADFYDHVAGSDALFDRADAAKMLRTGPKRLWNALREWKIVQASGTPYQRYFDLGYFRLVPVLVHKGEYSIPYQQTMVTGKGLTWIKALMDSQVMPGKAITRSDQNTHQQEAA
jgi:phage regulator Rha-like protein